MGNGLVPVVSLRNGIPMPQIGLGVWQVREGQEVEDAIAAALDAGYRLIDTAAVYGNERSVGKAIRDSELDRDEIFVTSKLWNDSHKYSAALRAFNTTIERLGVDYLDLYLIHWPLPMESLFLEAWRALEKLYDEGRVRAIGVSNFSSNHLKKLLNHSKHTPMINQIELHPRLQQQAIRSFCAHHNIAVESYSPLMQGGSLLHHPLLVQIASANHKTPAQIILRWHIQHGMIIIPNSIAPDRIVENMDIFDFALTATDMQLIDNLDDGSRIGVDPNMARLKK